MNHNDGLKDKLKFINDKIIWRKAQGYKDEDLIALYHDLDWIIKNYFDRYSNEEQRIKEAYDRGHEEGYKQAREDIISAN